MDERATRIMERGTGPIAPTPDVGSPTLQQVSVPVMDVLILQVPEVAANNIATRFKTTYLTTIEGKPTYIKMEDIRDKLNRNAIEIKSPFGGGLYGHL